MMSRRDLIVALASSLLAVPLVARAQSPPKSWRIGFVSLGTNVRPAYMEVTLDVQKSEDLPSVFSQMKRDRIDVVSVEPALYSYRRQIIDPAAASKLPALCENNVFVE